MERMDMIVVQKASKTFKGYYKERIAAVYASASRKFHPTNIDMGSRREHTRVHGYTVKQDIENRWEYVKLFPSFAIEQVIRDGYKLVLSLSRRINRFSSSEWL